MHKFQRLTSYDIVVEMTQSPSKGCYTAGQTYVAFIRVTQQEKLLIINYTQSQISVSEHVEQEMKILHHYILPDMPTSLINQLTDMLSLVHLNFANMKRRNLDIPVDADIKKADILLFNETKFLPEETFTTSMLGMDKRFFIFHNDRNVNRGGILLVSTTNVNHICYKSLHAELN